MSTQMFDELTKQVATVTSRRQVFKVLAGGVAAVAGTLLGSRSAEAAERCLCPPDPPGSAGREDPFPLDG